MELGWFGGAFFISKYRCLLLWTSLLELLLLHATSSDVLYFHLHLFQETFSPLISSLLHWSFSRVLFNFYVFINFSVFLLLVNSWFIPLWLEKILDMVLGFLSFLRFVFLLNIGSIPENILCVVEKNAFSVSGYNVLYMSGLLGL